MAQQGILAHSKPAAATNTLLYSAPIDQSASTVLTVANDGTGSNYSVAVKRYDQQLTVNASSYLLHEGDLVTGYKVTVDTPIALDGGFAPTALLTANDGESSFKFESFALPDYVEIFIKSVSIRSVAIESTSGTFNVGDTLTKGASPDDTTAVIYYVDSNAGVIYIGPSTINGAGTEFTDGDSVSTAGGAGATVSAGGVGTAANNFVFSTTTAGGTYTLYYDSGDLVFFDDRTYRFNVSDTSMSGLLFQLSDERNGEWGPDGVFGTADDGAEFTTGKTTNGTPGTAGAYVQYDFSQFSFVNNILYYYEGTTGTAANASYGGGTYYLTRSTDYTYTDFYVYDVVGTWTNSVDTFSYQGTTYTVTAQSAGPYGYVRSYSGTTLEVILGEGSQAFAGSDTFFDNPKSATGSRSVVTVSSVDVAQTAVEDDQYIAVAVTNGNNEIDKITSLVIGPGEKIIVNSVTQNNVFSLVGFEDTSNAFPARVFGTNLDTGN